MDDEQFRIKDLGVIINPAAGAGKAVIENVAGKAIEIFRDCNIVHPAPGNGRETTIRLAGEIATRVDAILVVGGDGTMSDVAYGLFIAGAPVPIIGIGAGSTNVGPLISVRPHEMERLDPYALKMHGVGGIQASLNKARIGLGFNDVVLGDTVLTTLEGRVMQVSAVEFIKGKKKPAAPLKSGKKDSEICIERRDEVVEIHKGIFGQMFAAPLEERYLGKGLAGGTSLAAALGLPAGIAITSEPIINYSIGPEDFLAKEPIVTKTASFRKSDEVIVKGLREGTCLIVDGNPLVILRDDDEVRLRYLPDVAWVLRPHISR
ncbi:MAG: diacylglycerol kinase family protein [Candidatus Methanoperedens sp.]|nr:diacylglycerol kinase family protein [Candidatus Methanoperedens sp.]MCZ7370458.1 diacylglycerol kinase family protein [Candidatus Methanoperedens sp.]